MIRKHMIGNQFGKRENPYKTLVTIRLNDDEARRLNALVRKEKGTKSSVLRSLLNKASEDGKEQ